MGSHSSRRVISPSSNSSASGAQSPGRRVSGSSHSYDSHSVEVTIPFFDDLYPKRVKMVNDLFYRQRYAAGDVIVDENKVGDPTDPASHCFYIIISGSVSVEIKNEDDQFTEHKQLKNGEWFGEYLLNASKIVPTRVTAREPTTILSLTNDKYSRFSNECGLSVKLRETPGLGAGDTPSEVVLRSLKFFESVPEDKLQLLAGLFRFRRYLPGDIIVAEGDPADGFFVIASGRVEVTVGLEESTRVHLDTLTAGNWFGEIALVNKTARTATVRAIEECVMLFLTNEHFDTFQKVATEVLQSSTWQNHVRKRMANSLKSVPFFRVYKQKQKGSYERFDDRTLGLLGELFHLIEIPEGDTLFEQGDPGDALYFIAQGRVKITTKMAPMNKSETLAYLKEGDIFGEIALMDDVRRTATAIATERLTLLTLNKEDFPRFCRIAPVLRSTIESIVAVRKERLFRTIPFFAAIRENKPWSKLGLLGALFRFEDYAANEFVFFQEDRAEKFYVIVDGRVDVLMKDEDDGESQIPIDHLSSNAWFGEMALLFDTPRTSSIKCRTNSTFLTLSRHNFEKLQKICPELHMEFNKLVEKRVATTLKNFGFFREAFRSQEALSSLDSGSDPEKEEAEETGAEMSALDELAPLLQYLSVSAGEVVVAEGSDHLRFYYLITGRCEVTSTDAKRRPLKLELLEPKSFFGELSLLDERCSYATVTALDRPCTFVTLDRITFRKFLDMPGIRPHIEDTIARRRAQLSELKVPEPAIAQSTRRQSTVEQSSANRPSGSITGTQALNTKSALMEAVAGANFDSDTTPNRSGSDSLNSSFGDVSTDNDVADASSAAPEDEEEEEVLSCSPAEDRGLDTDALLSSDN